MQSGVGPHHFHQHHGRGQLQRALFCLRVGARGSRHERVEQGLENFQHGAMRTRVTIAISEQSHGQAVCQRFANLFAGLQIWLSNCLGCQDGFGRLCVGAHDQ